MTVSVVMPHSGRSNSSMACRKAAEERVLTQSALAASSKELWRLVSTEGMSVKDAAKTLGIPANTASKIKRRIETMVAAVEAEFDARVEGR